MDKKTLTRFAAQARKILQAAVSEVHTSVPDNVVEEVSYTWFMRLCALRYMEVNGYLSNRVFTDATNEYIPVALGEPAAYKQYIIDQCKALGGAVQSLFRHVSESEEKLFPESILGKDAQLLSLLTSIPVAEWKEGVQILGWLFQYYHSDKREEAFSALKEEGYVRSDLLPVATQLFTPEWIVQYLVENSLGHLWLNAHPNPDLQESWKYFLPEPEQEAPITVATQPLAPEDIRCIDPCMGCGHILAYVFDVLMQIYRSVGYSDSDAVASIVCNNIHGLDIDEKAVMLASFIMTMKARQYDADWFSHYKEPRVYAVQQSNALLSRGDEKTWVKLRDSMWDAGEYGSLLTPTFNATELSTLRRSVGDSATLRELVATAELLSVQYDVVITNPPYMGAACMAAKLSSFIKQNYPDTKADLYAVFMERCLRMTKSCCYMAMVTQHSWMFLAALQQLRGRILHENIVSLLHLGARAFDEIVGEVVQTAAFVVRKRHLPKYRGVYCRLTDVILSKEKENLFHTHSQEFIVDQSQFRQVRGAPILYWMHPALLRTFSLPALSTVSHTINGLTTGDNTKFLRLWHEVCFDKIDFCAKSTEDSVKRGCRWFPYNKGGGYRKWSGNNDYVINWFDDGREIKDHGHLVSRGMQYQFLPSITWSKIASPSPSFRFKEAGSMFDVGGLSLFPFSEEHSLYLLGLLNSTYARTVLECLSPTLNCETGHVASIPVSFPADVSRVNRLVADCIHLALLDWDSNETSPSFKVHPLVRHHVSSLREAYREWEKEARSRFQILKQKEEAINLAIITEYGLTGYVSHRVDDKEISVALANQGRDIRSFLSFAVGCMFGRYSLDEEGLIYAGGQWDPVRFRRFHPCEDNILPICTAVSADGGIVTKLEEFLVALYGEETLEDNLLFIARALGKKSKNPRIVLRRYFTKEFFADHCRMYKKRPVYWLFDSGKGNAFKGLMYMHRYDDTLLERLHASYVEPILKAWQECPDEQKQELAAELSCFEKWLLLRAHCRIPLDSDAGVKYNYSTLFPELLAKIK